MRHPSAAGFVKGIKSFIVSFLNDAPDAERDSVAVQEFLGNMEAALRAHPFRTGSSEEELESAGEMQAPRGNRGTLNLLTDNSTTVHYLLGAYLRLQTFVTIFERL